VRGGEMKDGDKNRETGKQESRKMGKEIKIRI
jgi:hypothetical protein